jgi:transposase
VDGRLHVACTALLTHPGMHATRGRLAYQDIGILPERTGWVVHDGYRSYEQHPQARHALCNAHHLRELQFPHERYQQSWAEPLTQLLQALETALAAGCSELPARSPLANSASPK